MTTEEKKFTKEEEKKAQADATPSRQFAIYDLKNVQRPILTVFDACEAGDLRALARFSKDKDFDVDSKDRYGRTPLIWAADCGNLKICENLIRLGASIHVADMHTGRTALHWAARSGSLPIVRLLVQFGANITKEDKYGLTPLYLARTRGDDGDEVFKYLLAEGAPYNEHKLIDASEIEKKIEAELNEIRKKED